MSSERLTDDEFRLLAFMRGYVDGRDQSLDPGWIQEQFGWTVERLQLAARALAVRELIEFFEWMPAKALAYLEEPIPTGTFPSDIRLTERGWKYLREPEL